MKNTTKQSTFQTERKNTDESLGAEREKTNSSIAQIKGKAESQTDKSVQEERSASDLKTSAARSKADLHRDNTQFSEEKDIVKSVDKQISDERQIADAAVARERTQVDVAIVQEREVKKSSETKLLDQERKQTDQNLAVERTRTDTVVMTTSVRLSTEVEEHTKTKVSLTTRDEFLAIVSHDLRNPIGVITSCMEMLLEEAVERKIDSETKSWLELAKRNADASLRLINDILDMERVAEGKLEMSIAPCDLGKVVRESLDNFVHVAAAKNVLLRSVPATLTGDVICDRDRLLQVLSNLIGNALKFTPEQGKVVIKAEWTEKNVTVSICDTGPGIPDEKKEHIFERFIQLGSKDRTGLGLGLHISKMLVEAQGGKLWVESKVGEGSTFFFQLPISDSK